jgi:NAD(P)H-dependent flavin oxidoreductase YrpB (nitropropane dioxygenase family)
VRTAVTELLGIERPVLQAPMWAGQAAGLAREHSAAEIVERMATAAERVLDRLAR